MKTFYFSLFILLYNFPLLAQNNNEGDGLTGKYYQGWSLGENNVILFDGLVQSFSRVDTFLNFWNGNRYYQWAPVGGWSNNYSVNWNGHIFIEQAGRYGFGIISDDGSQLYIDGNLVVDNSSSQWFDYEDNISEGDTANSIFPHLILDRGYHAIDIRYFEDSNYDGIQIFWLTPDHIDSSVIPYNGTTFHGTSPSYNPLTNWTIIPKRVLFSNYNAPPSAQTDSVYAFEDSFVVFSPITNDSDPENDSLIILSYDQPQNGNVTNDQEVYTYTPNINFFGIDSFHYFVIDTFENADTALVWIEVTNVNDDPTPFNLVSPENNSAVETISNISFTWYSSSDLDEDTLIYSLKIFSEDSDTLIESTNDTSIVFNGGIFLQPDHNYQWTVWVSDIHTYIYADTFQFTTPTITQIQNDKIIAPLKFQLGQNYPNPFNPSTTIQYTIPQDGRVSLKIYDITGKLVSDVLDQWKTKGIYSNTLNFGELPSGIYFYILKTSISQKTKKMLLIK